jgi:hypothetical protein
MAERSSRKKKLKVIEAPPLALARGGSGPILTTDYTDGHGSGQIEMINDLSSVISRAALSMFSSKKEARESRE